MYQGSAQYDAAMYEILFLTFRRCIIDFGEILTRIVPLLIKHLRSTVIATTTTPKRLEHYIRRELLRHVAREGNKGK
jgi:hypothetical protein